MLNSDISISLSSLAVTFLLFTNVLCFTTGTVSESSRIELPRLVLLPVILAAFTIEPAKTSTPPTSGAVGASLRRANCDSIFSFNSAIFGLVRAVTF